MSESASRELRRDMRRAVGSEALAVIDSHSHALEDVVHNLNALQARVEFIAKTCEKEWAKLDARANIADGSATVNDQHIKETYAALMAHRDMSFMDRLRWLFVGNR